MERVGDGRASHSFLSTAGLARACARRPWVAIAGWVVALVIAGVAMSGLGDVITTDDSFLNNPESERADELSWQRFAPTGSGEETVIVHSETLTVDDPAFQGVVEQTQAALLAMPEIVAEAPTYYEARAVQHPQAEQLVSADRHTTLIPATLAFTFDPDRDLDRFLETVEGQGGDGFTVLSVGEESVDQTINETSESDLAKEIIGLPFALVVLVVVFGALIAAGVPMVLALTAVVVALGLAALIGRAFELSVFVVNMITGIGLAVGIDYALFLVERYREERRHGHPKLDAITIAGGTASKAVLFSGLTVVLALTGMFLIPTTIFRSLGMGAILVTIVAVVATLTLVPAMLSLLGDRIDWPRRRDYDAAAAEERAHPETADVRHGFWGRLTDLVMARPAVSALLAAALLVAAALPYFDMKIGTAGVSLLPESEVKTAFALLNRQFYGGFIAPVEVVVDAQRSPEVDAGVERLVAAMGQDPSFGPVIAQQWNDAGDAFYLAVPLTGDAQSPEAAEAVERLREEVIPAAFAGVQAEVLVGGDSAESLDFNNLVDDWTPVVFAFVLGLSFLLLLLAFRSLVVPLKAIIMNLLSVGAAYGLMVLVFQKGYGHDFLGVQRTPTIETWVPIFLFCVLFGLSMDYHVFLLSRIREHFDRTHRNQESVALGLAMTARIITGAALIMVVVFGAFATGDLVMFQQMGFGLSVAILLDATIVRSVLVPATMALLGDRNWYLPTWLRWLPDLRVEGAPAPRPVSGAESSGD